MASDNRQRRREFLRAGSGACQGRGGDVRDEAGARQNGAGKSRVTGAFAGVCDVIDARQIEDGELAEPFGEIESVGWRTESVGDRPDRFTF